MKSELALLVRASIGNHPSMYQFREGPVQQKRAALTDNPAKFVQARKLDDVLTTAD